MYTEETKFKIGLQYFGASGEGGSADQGGAGGEGQGGAEGGSEGGTQGGTPAEKTFTQDQVNTMMANEKRTARNALLKELGYEVKEGAKVADIVKTVKGILDAGKTQQQLDQGAVGHADADDGHGFIL